MTDILQTIAATKRTEVAAMKRVIPMETMLELAKATKRDVISMRDSILAHPVAIIAEHKRRSPSKGEIAPMSEVAEVTEAYATNGAAAMSVLTDTPYFGGSLTDLAVARSVAPFLPILRKEFIVDEYQICQARVYGADAVLLIAAMIDKETLQRLNDFAHSLGLQTLVEVHSEEELESVPEDADMVGVNNRDLTSFHTDIANSARLIGNLPKGAVKIAESGIKTPEDLQRLKAAGFNGFLIGEALMASGNPGETLSKFIHSNDNDMGRRLKIKVCGMKQPENIREVAELKPDFMGFIFYDPSPRCCRGIPSEAIRMLPLKGITPVMVSVDMPEEELEALAALHGFSVLQLHGKESPEQCARLRGQGFCVWKAIPFSPETDTELLESYVGKVDMFVFDTPTSGHGGSGHKFDWSLLAAYSLPVPFMLGGGISLDDAEALKALNHPMLAGFDVNSRFETTPGVKDAEKLQKFIKL